MGRILPPKTDFEHARVWPTQFRLRFLDHDRHTDRRTDIYISREISIEHPSVGLASLAQSREISIEHPVCGARYARPITVFIVLGLTHTIPSVSIVI